MNFKKIIFPVIIALFLSFFMQQSFAKPKDDISTLYYGDGTFSGYTLWGIAFNSGGGTAPSLIIDKLFTDSGTKYIINFPLFSSLPSVILKGEVLIGDKAFPLKKITPPSTPSDFPALFNTPHPDRDFYSYSVNSWFYNPTLFEISEDILKKVTETPKGTDVIFSVQGIQKDIVHHVRFHSSIINGLPILLQLTPQDADEYFRRNQKGSGDSNNPKIIVY